MLWEPQNALVAPRRRQYFHNSPTPPQIYEEMAFPVVEGVLTGFNGTVFAYGQTGEQDVVAILCEHDHHTRAHPIREHRNAG